MERFVIFALVGAVIITVFFSYLDKQRKKKATLQRDCYQASLKGNDKAKALELGRAYYSFLRDGKITLIDEQAIANDLSTMKE